METAKVVDTIVPERGHNIMYSEGKRRPNNQCVKAVNRSVFNPILSTYKVHHEFIILPLAMLCALIMLLRIIETITQVIRSLYQRPSKS